MFVDFMCCILYVVFIVVKLLYYIIHYVTLLVVVLFVLKSNLFSNFVTLYINKLRIQYVYVYARRPKNMT